MIDGRKRAAGALATLCIATLGGSVLTAAPSSADPTIVDVRERVDRLYHEAEQASERYNDARLELRRARTRLHALEAELERKRDRVEAVSDPVAVSAVAQYRGQALSAVSQVVLSDDPVDVLSQLTGLSKYNARQVGVVADLSVHADRLKVRKRLVRLEIATMANVRSRLAAEKATIEERTTEAESLLDRLEEQLAEREARASRSSSRASVPEVAASGGAAAAVAYAMAQVGDAYVYGAAGPSGFDCSGLTMMAWAAAGVALPHSSSAQMGSGVPVSTSALQPGDLVFYYSPVSHVGMYIGNGMIVHAANPSTGVQVAPLTMMPLSGAVRPG